MKEIDPKDTGRELIFEISKTSPMPMVTITKTVDVKPVVKLSKKKGFKYNSLFCWCLGKAASGIEQFYTVPHGDRFLRYDELRISVVVTTKSGKYNFAGIPYSDSFEKFNEAYIKNTEIVADTDNSYGLDGEFARLGTSVILGCEIDSVVNFYCPSLSNPFLAWGKYRKGHFSAKLPISFSFDHAQMDGYHAASFFRELQAVIDNIKDQV